MKILLFANTDWYLYNFRQNLARDLLVRGHDVVLASPPGDYAAKLLQAGFKWRALRINRRSVNPLAALISLAQLFKLYRHERPDVAHHFTLKCVILGSLAARLARVHCVVNSITGLGFVYTSRSPLARVLRPVLSVTLRLLLNRVGSRVILQNRDDVEELVESRIVNVSIARLIVSSGVDCSRFRPRKSGADDDGRVCVLLATRLLWEKGLGEYAEAARILRESGSRAEFLLAGAPDAGNPSAVPALAIEIWQRGGHIKFLGNVSDMLELLHQVQIVVLPSYREGAPRILVEAAACGLPIVTTDAPGCREVVEHGRNGLLVAVRDAAALASALRVLIDSPSLRQAFGAYGRSKAIAEFDQRTILAATRGVYEELLKEKEGDGAIERMPR